MVQVSFYLEARKFCNSLGALWFCWVKDSIKMPHDKEWGKAFKSSVITLQSLAAVYAILTGLQELNMVTKQNDIAVPFILHFQWQKPLHIWTQNTCITVFENTFLFVHSKQAIHFILQLWVSLASRHSPISNFNSIYMCVYIYLIPI